RPSLLWRDIKEFARNHGRVKPLFALIAFALAGGMVSMMYFGSEIKKPDPELIFVQNMNGPRSDAEIIANNQRDQKKLEIRQEESRKRWREFGQMLGYPTK
ncbi:MAG: hypothetical protein ABF416_04870, partial [Zymomonas mobilis subsp. pomaceae]